MPALEIQSFFACALCPNSYLNLPRLDEGSLVRVISTAISNYSLVYLKSG